MNELEPLPCPFCGLPASVYYEDDLWSQRDCNVELLHAGVLVARRRDRQLEPPRRGQSEIGNRKSAIRR